MEKLEILQSEARKKFEHLVTSMEEPKNIEEVIQFYRKMQDAFVEEGTVFYHAALQEGLLEALKLIPPLYQDERPEEDGVPVETYGFEATHNNALKEAVKAIASRIEWSKNQ